MPRRYYYKFTAKQNKKIRSAVSKFNYKINKLIKQNPSLAFVYPEKVTVGYIKSRITSAKDLNDELRKLGNFLKRGAEDIITNERGVATTKWQLHETKIQARRINKKQAKEEKKKEENNEFKNDVERAKYTPKVVDFENRTAQGWELYVKSIEKQSAGSYDLNKRIKYKEDYLQNIAEHLHEGIYVNRFTKLIKAIDADVLYDAFYEDPVLTIRFISDPQKANEIIHAAYNRWIVYLREKNIKIPKYLNKELEEI